MSNLFGRDPDEDRKSRRTDARRDRLRRKSAERSEGKHGRFSSLALKLKLSLCLGILLAAVFGCMKLISYIETSTDIRLTDKGFNHAGRFENSIAVNGIDVSVHQGEEIKWKKVKSSGADFVFIRAGYRSADDGSLHTDSNFEANMKGAGKAGIMTGVYFYSQALTPEEAKEEAEYLLDLVSKYDPDLPLVIDFEIYPEGRLEKKIQAGELYASSLYHDIVLSFCRRVEAGGYESAVYANTDMLTHYMDYKLLQKEATIWLAEYGESSELDADYMFWQCSQEALVGGISGNVDHDFWYIEPGKVYSTRAAGTRKKRVSIGECRVSFADDSYKLKTKRAEPRIVVTRDGKRIRNGSDYEYSFVNNTESGTGYVIIRGKGLYKDWMAVPFTIE